MAQTDTASITELVSDPAGAVVGGARLAVVNQDTNVTSSVQTNDKGLFFVPDLRPGVYTVSSSHPGFKLSKRSGIELRVGRTA